MLPVFRRMIKAIGEHGNPKATAYRYKLLEYLPDGKYIVRPAVFIADTQLRADGDKSYEVQEAGVWGLLSEAEYRVLKLAWDGVRAQRGYDFLQENAL